jgi:SGNH hydrolase-like domain, acetyltransferase AlgX
LSLAEGFLRLFPASLPYDVRKTLEAQSRDLGIAHPYVGYLHKPFHTGVMSSLDFRAIEHTDGYGFRNAWPWPEQAEIIALGDSFTFGYGAEDNQSWPAILAHTLAPNRVINLGLIGAGTNQYLRVYETFGVKLHPKLILIGAFMENDFWDAEMFDLWLKSGVGGNEMYWKMRGQFEFNSRHPVTSLIGTLRLHSYLFNLVKSARDSWQSNKPVPAWWAPSEFTWRHPLTSLMALIRLRSDVISSGKGAPDSWQSHKPVFYSCADGSRLRLVPGELANAVARSQPGSSDFQLVLDAVVRIHELARSKESHELILFQPSKEEVYLPLLRSDIPDLTSSLRTALEKKGIEYLDLTPALRRRATAGDCLFFGTDGHPNVSGYAAIAETVAAHLKQNAQRYGLVSDDKPPFFDTSPRNISSTPTVVAGFDDAGHLGHRPHPRDVRILRKSNPDKAEITRIAYDKLGAPQHHWRTGRRLHSRTGPRFGPQQLARG